MIGVLLINLIANNILYMCTGIIALSLPHAHTDELYYPSVRACGQSNLLAKKLVTSLVINIIICER